MGRGGEKVSILVAGVFITAGEKLPGLAELRMGRSALLTEQTRVSLMRLQPDNLARVRIGEVDWRCSGCFRHLRWLAIVIEPLLNPLKQRISV